MRAVVFGASGATGKQVVREFINRKIHTRILIRESAILANDIQDSPWVEIVIGNISELNQPEMNLLLHDRDVIVSCLGHNPTLKGIFGKPHDLVFEAVKKICETVKLAGDREVKLILMSTAGYTNTLYGETNSFGEKIVFSLLNAFLPPQRDNVRAANYLVSELGRQDRNVGWVVVRPDTLINDDEQSPYEVMGSPARSPLFNSGKTSRINVSHFMAELATNPLLWNQWESKTPVIYNK